MKHIHLRCNLFLLQHHFPTGFLFPCVHGKLFIFGVRDDAQQQKGWFSALLCIGGMPWSGVTLAVVGLMGIPLPCLGVWVLLGEVPTLTLCPPGSVPSPGGGLRPKCYSCQWAPTQTPIRTVGLHPRHTTLGAVSNL